MSKYKNIGKTSLIVSSKGNLTLVKAGESIELDSLPPGYDGYLVEELTKPVKVDISDIVEHQTSDLPEDFVVLIDDDIVEDLRKEQEKPIQKKRGRRAKK